MIGDPVIKDAGGAEDQRSGGATIAVLDRSPIRRSCIAAILSPIADGEVRIAETAFGLDPQAAASLIIFPLEAGDERLAEFNSEVAQIRSGNSAAKIGVIADDLKEFAGHPDADLAELSVLLPASIKADLLSAAVQLAQMGFRLMPEWAQGQDAQQATTCGSLPHPECNQTTQHPLLANCTPRQVEVIERLILGLSNREIAQQMEISESTVKAHIRVVMELLNVSNRTQIVSKLIFAKH